MRDIPYREDFAITSICRIEDGNETSVERCLNHISNHESGGAGGGLKSRI